MLGMKDEITVWENGTQKRERKYYLTIFLQEAHETYTELSKHRYIKHRYLNCSHISSLQLIKRCPYSLLFFQKRFYISFVQ